MVSFDFHPDFKFLVFASKDILSSFQMGPIPNKNSFEFEFEF
jgi:hypothetical protein